MLPREAIRFFCVDQEWVASLLDGAFSIGRVTGADRELECAVVQPQLEGKGDSVSGFLLRSDVVSGWPGLLVDGYNSDDQPLDLLRMDRLSPNVLLVLFAGEIAAVEIHLKPETMHFGFDRSDGATFFKVLRNGTGKKERIDTNDIPWKNENERVLAVAELADRMRDRTERSQDPFTSAQFALEMIEGVEKVRFEKR
jgi:hypothetical protein